MHKLILALAITAATTLGGASAASAFERKVTIDTNRGTISKTSEVYCFEGACYREAELTGVNGYTLKSSGMCVLVQQGEYDCKGTVTGPQGGSRTRQVHVTVN